MISTSLFSLFLITHCSFVQFSENDFIKAAHYFDEAKKTADRDGGNLWGYNLYGPIIFVDPKTYESIANENDSAQTFKKKTGIFSGNVPTSFGVANTARNWQGKVWTIIRWPLPENSYERQNLIMHELYHQLQRKENRVMPEANCAHLDKFEGRLLLKLELEALRNVLTAYPRFNEGDLQAALRIRMARYQKFPGADSLERILEQNEGLAEFTGVMLSGRTDTAIKQHLISSIDEFYQKQSFVRSMAYITGPIYGFLLSHKNKNWNKTFFTTGSNQSASSFQEMIAKTYHFSIPQHETSIVNAIAQQGLYDYNAIYGYEKSREDTRLHSMEENKRKFIDGPILILPNAKMNFVFNPNEVQMIDDYGPVYPTFSGNADWGTLTVKKGGVFIKDWMYVYIPLPENFNSKTTSVDTGDWSLVLKEGWKIKESKRPGDYEVVRSN